MTLETANILNQFLDMINDGRSHEVKGVIEELLEKHYAENGEAIKQ